MNEEIEYAEMLEIPVSTVNVVQKNRRKRKQKNAVLDSAEKPLKDTVLAQVNDRLQNNEEPDQISMDPNLLAESANSNGTLDFDSIPERIDTIRLYSTDETNGLWSNELHAYDYPLNNENEGGMYEMKPESRLSKAIRITLGAEFVAACVLCGAIFLTNVFMPNSAINTFFRSIGSAPIEQTANTKTYADFTLSSVVSTLTDTELNLSDTGILTFTDATCVYPVANGEIAMITQNSNGLYSIKIAYSDSFTSVIDGLDYVYYAEGESIKNNIPVGYSNGKTEVQVTMYSNGTLLNCFELTEENCLAWVESQAS